MSDVKKIRKNDPGRDPSDSKALRCEAGAIESFHQANFRRRGRYTAVFVVLAAAFFVILVLNINSGNVHIPVSRIFQIIFTGQGDPEEVDIINTIRMPRILTSAILGGALAMSGFLLQTFFENPIAGPFVLGISSGAKMVVAFVMIIYVQHAMTMSSYTMIAAAFVGALMSTGFILLINIKVKNMAALLVAGIMVGYICSAVTDFMITFADDSDIANLYGWSMGSFSGMSWSNVALCASITGVCLVFTLMLSKPISAFQLGEAYAQSVGVNIRIFRVTLILLSSLLSATVTAFAGPISFVGIAVPYLIKGALRTSKPLIVIPATFLGGGVFCMFCDIIARLAFAPIEMNISTVTSVFGAPVVIYMMVTMRTKK